MNTQDVLASAVSVLESPLTTPVRDAIIAAAPPAVGTAVLVASNMLPKLYRMFQSFRDGQIDEGRLKQDWDRMLVDGELADAIVAHGEALRQAQQGASAKPGE